MPVAGVPASATATRDPGDFDLENEVRSVVIYVTPDNPVNASETVSFSLTGGGVTVQGTVDARDGADQPIGLTRSEVQALLGSVVTSLQDRVADPTFRPAFPAGFGFDLGCCNLAASVMHRDTGRLRRVTSVMITLFGMGR